MVAVPLSGRAKPKITRRVVVLPAPLAQEPRHRPRLYLEAQIVDGQGGPEVLRQVVDLDHYAAFVVPTGLRYQRSRFGRENKGAGMPGS